MKAGLLQIIYANPFSGLDHEYPYNHLTKFYEISGILVDSNSDSHWMLYVY